MRLAVVGAGFWSTYQVAAWRELGVEILGVCDRDLARAARFGAPSFDNLDDMLDATKPDVLDVITGVENHAEAVAMADRHRVPVICQKPMARTMAEAKQMVRDTTVPFFVHENWRWQSPLRMVYELIQGGAIGAPFRARFQFACSFPVFTNQPALAELKQFILTDVGSHVLDVPRLMFGEAQRLYAQTNQVNRTIRGEDVATVMMRMGDVDVVCDMSYASRLAYEAFPQTYAVIEGDLGSIELAKDYTIRITKEAGSQIHTASPRPYDWADPAYLLVQSSIVDCNGNLLQGLQGGPCETTAVDNLETLRLVFAAYESARTREAINLLTYER